MTTSGFDSFRPPEPPRRRRRGGGQRRRGGGQADAGGAREMPVVPDAEFTSYYGRPIVKAPPWEEDIAAYLFLGGVAAGSGLLAAGAQLTGNTALRRTTRFAALAGAGLGTIALICDLGRPERFLNMLRTLKVTSPMSVGSWILVAFSAGAGVAAAGEVERALPGGGPAPVRVMRAIVRRAEGAGGILAGLLAPGLASYTAVLLTNTAIPTWSGSREHLPFVFAGSAAMAAGGLAMVTTPIGAAGPARNLAVAGAAADIIATRVMLQRMDEVESEPLRDGESGDLLKTSTALAVGGAAATVLVSLATRVATRSGSARTQGLARAVAVGAGVALVASSALNRWGVFRAGMASARDPRYTVEPQKRRLEERRARRRASGGPDDSITTL